MHIPSIATAIPVTDSVTVIPSFLPVAGFGVLPINATLISGAEPVLVDAGIRAVQNEFMATLASCVTLSELRWIWITHADPDHTGNLKALLDVAPNATIITTFVGMGKLNLAGFPVERVRLVNPGETFVAGGRSLQTITPPTFDAPETTAIFDPLEQILFSSDCCGALLPDIYQRANDIPDAILRDGIIGWTRVDAPWLDFVDGTQFEASLDQFRALSARHVLSSHLPPAENITDRLLDAVSAARLAPAFSGPDHATFEAIMAKAGA